MINQSKQPIVYTLILSGLLIFLFGLYLQNSLYMSWDVSWLMEVSRRLLAGGSYANNFFENNPPLILYLYLPPVLLAKIPGISLSFALKAYISLIAFTSLTLCYQQLKSCWPKGQENSLAIFWLMLAVIYMVMPIYEFGQREHLFFMLAMPYALLMTNRLYGHTISNHTSISIGLIAGIGFMIKPYFLFPFILMEFYYFIKVRYVRLVFRPELLTALTVFFLYADLVLIRHWDYVSIIAPFAARWNYLAIRLPALFMLTYLPILPAVITLFFSLFILMRTQYKEFIIILSLFFTGAYFSYFIQGTIFYYHLYPVLAISFLASILLLNAAASHNKTLLDYSYFIFLILSLFYFYSRYAVTNLLIFQPIHFYFLYSLLFFICLSISYPHSSRKIPAARTILGLTVLTMTGCYLLLKLIQTTDFYIYKLAVINLILIFCSGAFLHTHIRGKLNGMLCFSLSLLIFSFPFIYIKNYFFMEAGYKTQFNTLVDLINKQAAHKPIYFLSNRFAVLSPLLNDTTSIYSSRFSCLWMIAGLHKAALLNQYPQQIIERDKNYFIDMIADDLINNKPAIVIVDISPDKLYFYTIERKTSANYLKPVYHFTPLAFDYLNYFSDNKHFVKAWRDYYLLTTIDHTDNLLVNMKYKFAIYKRKTE